MIFTKIIVMRLESFFESKVRVGILKSLIGGKKSLLEIKKSTNSTSQAINKQVKILIKLGLVKKLKRGQYEITKQGEVLASKIISISDFMEIIEKHSEFWNSHNVDEIPEELLNRLEELKNIEIVNSDISPDRFQRSITQVIENTKEKLVGATSVVTVDWVKAATETADRGVKMSVLFTRKAATMQEDGAFKNYPYMNHPNIEVMLYQDIRQSLVSNGREMVIAFHEDGVLDLKNVIVSDDERAIKWVEDLFWWYWEKGELVE